VGRLNDGRPLLRAAVDLFRYMQMQTWLERTEAELGALQTATLTLGRPPIRR
jgi:hypothetical protein